QVDRAQALRTYRVVQQRELLVERRAVGHIDAAHPPVAGVDADAEARVPAGRLDEHREHLGITYVRAALAGAVLEQQPRPARAGGVRSRALAGLERAKARVGDPIAAGGRAALGSLVRARVED